MVKQLPWTDPLKVWELNNSLKKKKTKRKKHHLQRTASKEKQNEDGAEEGAAPQDVSAEEDGAPEPTGGRDTEETAGQAPRNGEEEENERSDAKDESQAGSGSETRVGEGGVKALKFRVTCNRAGDKHSFTSNEAARDFGGAVQEHFQWKADMTNFDVEVQRCVCCKTRCAGVSTVPAEGDSGTEDQ